MTSSRNRAASRQPHPRMGAPPFVRRRRPGRRTGPAGGRAPGPPGGPAPAARPPHWPRAFVVPLKRVHSWGLMASSTCRPPAASVGPGSGGSWPRGCPAPASPARTAACVPPCAACWSGSGPRPPRATGVSGPPGRRPGQGPPQAVPQGRGACGAPLTRAAARWQPVQQANGRGRWVQGPAGQRSVKAVVRPRADLEPDQDKPAAALKCRSRTAQVSLR
jgi:hypothetical protein